jgi:hypothetical protein
VRELSDINDIFSVLPSDVFIVHLTKYVPSDTERPLASFKFHEPTSTDLAAGVNVGGKSGRPQVVPAAAGDLNLVDEITGRVENG